MEPIFLVRHALQLEPISQALGCAVHGQICSHDLPRSLLPPMPLEILATHAVRVSERLLRAHRRQHAAFTPLCSGPQLLYLIPILPPILPYGPASQMHGDCARCVEEESCGTLGLIVGSILPKSDKMPTLVLLVVRNC